ncbi:junctional adhesion molecule-like isoform X2 [Scyliorhinus canicula]|uniref:junctional adhesion molecule-like isoform X2 n=1 Tax=Scyliorhinus canicula TaxID=7830 RepID=UPI0018F5A788|nr:junctional adhesion molecule-like isoform X2 [Scyliorhinus canicula]
MMNSGMGFILFLFFLIFNGICLIFAIGVSTPNSLVVHEGMELRLDCNLEYHVGTQLQNIKLEWSHTPYGDTEEDLIFFHYRNHSVVVQNNKFSLRLQWVGDIRKNNGSILITEVECSDNGSFTCDMRIPRFSNNIYRRKINLVVLCKDAKDSRSLKLPGLAEAFPNNITIYTTVGILTFFVAFFITLVSVWKKRSINATPRSQRRNYLDGLEDSEDACRYVTVTRNHQFQIDSENDGKKGKETKEAKTDEEEVYVTMRSFIGIGN